MKHSRYRAWSAPGHWGEGSVPDENVKVEEVGPSRSRCILEAQETSLAAWFEMGLKRRKTSKIMALFGPEQLGR